MFSLSDTPCQSILPNDGKIATKLWLAMGPFQIMLMSIRQTRSLDSRTHKHGTRHAYVVYIYNYIYLTMYIITIYIRLYYIIYIYVETCRFVSDASHRLFEVICLISSNNIHHLGQGANQRIQEVNLLMADEFGHDRCSKAGLFDDMTNVLGHP